MLRLNIFIFLSFVFFTNSTYAKVNLNANSLELIKIEASNVNVYFDINNNTFYYNSTFKHFRDLVQRFEWRKTTVNNEGLYSLNFDKHKNAKTWVNAKKTEVITSSDGKKFL